MSGTLKQAIARLEQLPDERQEQLAGLLLHEIDEDERWQRTTEAHAGKLSELITEVLEADRRGECEPLEPETL